MNSDVEFDTWVQDNDRGLMLAANGDWAEASEAFAAAADSLARSLPSMAGAHEPLALVLSNLAQAAFRSGRPDEALQHAQRVCALRVAIAGEDAMPVARARMDLAVMLASRGRLDEARTLILRAINAVEHRVGGEDARLAIVLENAARIALASGNPANAEPLLIRLHALLDAHELSTSRADALLERVATARARQMAATMPMTAPAMATPAVVEAPLSEPETMVVSHETPEALDAFADDAALRVYAHASISAHEEWEDQPLRDAVAITDVLLRTTPSGVPIIPMPTPVEPPALGDEEASSALGAISGPLDALSDFSFDLADETPAVLPVAEALAPVDEPAEDDLLPLDLVDVSPPMATADTDGTLSPAARDDQRSRIDYPSPQSNAGLLLDFAVEHGVVDDAVDEPMLQAPPISSRIPDALDELPAEVAAPVVSAERTQIVTSGSSKGIAPMADMMGTAPPHSAADTPAPSSSATMPEPQRGMGHSKEDRVVMPAPTPSSGKGKLIAMIAGAVVVAGGAAAFFLLK